MSRAVQASDAEARQWRRNVERAAAPQPTPQPVIDAMQVIAAHCRARGYCGAYVADTGGGSFYRVRPVDELLTAIRADLLALADTAAAMDTHADPAYLVGLLAGVRQMLALIGEVKP